MNVKPLLSERSPIRMCAYDWASDKRGDGLALYSFASHGNFVEGDDWPGDSHADEVIDEIQNRIAWCEMNLDTKESKDLPRLHRLLAWVEKHRPTDPVIFRVCKRDRFNEDHEFVSGRIPKVGDADEHDVVAILPTFPGDESRASCACFTSDGGHSSCIPYHVISESRWARPEEYGPVLDHMREAYGYHVRVYRRLQPWMRKERD